MRTAITARRLGRIAAAKLEVRRRCNGLDIVVSDTDSGAITEPAIYLALTRRNAEKLLVALDLMLSETEDETNPVHDLVY